MGQVIGAQNMQLNTALGTFIRIVANSTSDLAAANSIVHEIREMQHGADIPLRVARAAITRMRAPRADKARQERLTNFCAKYQELILWLARRGNGQQD
jgi:hypothetical protein